MAIHKKIYLDELPKWGKGGKAKEGSINWKECIGKIVKFEYGEIKSEIKILNYHQRVVTIKYKEEEFTMYTDNFIKCKFSRLTKVRTKDFKYKIDTIVKTNLGSIKIIDRRYNDLGKKLYKYVCVKCKQVGEIEESNLNKGYGCKFCIKGSKIVTEGINDLKTTDSWILEYLKDKDDYKKYSRGSGQYILVQCPHCKKVYNKKVVDVIKCRSIGCDCGDGKSHSEKFICNLLGQLKIDFITEYSCDWCKSKRYDFYIPSLNLIIEVNGKQHYMESGGYFRKTLQEEQENDRFKKELALANDIKRYIELDCRESSLKWIKNSVLNSELNELFDLREINWIKCEEFALKNIVKEVCEYWNNKGKQYTYADLGKIFNLDRTTIKDYLIKGKEIGWCDIKI